MEFNQQASNEWTIKKGILGFFEKRVKLKSGRESNYYLNYRNAVFKKTLSEQLIDYLAAYVSSLGLNPDYYLGVPEGAKPLGRDLNKKLGIENLAEFRSAPKAHGDPKDRYFLGDVNKGDKVVVIEDITTTGGSLMGRLDQCVDMDLNIMATVCLANRLEKTKDLRHSVEEAIKERYGVRHYSMSDAEQLLPLAYKLLKPSDEIVKAIERDFIEYGVKEIKLR